MASTLKEVARLAGVSPSTVSRVVRGEDSVSEGARLRVQQTIEKVGYQPNNSARTIRTGRSHAVGYVVPDISNWFYSVVFRGAESMLSERGYELLLSTSKGDLTRESLAISSLASRNTDGFILSLADENADRLPSVVHERPTVLLDRGTSKSEHYEGRFDSIRSDHADGMRSAVNYLIDLGHRRIALYTGQPDLYTSRSRTVAFRETCGARGLSDSDTIVFDGDRSVTAGERNTAQLLNAPNRPSAIIAGSNQLLHGTLNMLNVMNVRFPEELSLIACEDSDIGRLYRPAITVVRRNVEELGRTAAAVLLQRFEEQAAGARQDVDHGALLRLLPTELVVRASTGPPSRSDT